MDALDDIPKEEQRTAASRKELFPGRRLFMIPQAGMTCEQAAKRKAHGFHTFRGFASMIYLVAGQLPLAVPRPC